MTTEEQEALQAEQAAEAERLAAEAGTTVVEKIVEKVRDLTPDEERGIALRYVEENPGQFYAPAEEQQGQEFNIFDPDAVKKIHSDAVAEAEARMLRRSQLEEYAVEDARKAFQGKNVPDEAFSAIRKAFREPGTNLEDLAGHIKAGTHRKLVTNKIGELALEGQWSHAPSEGSEPVGGRGQGLSEAQATELAKAEGMLGRKLTDSEKREWVVSN